MKVLYAILISILLFVGCEKTDPVSSSGDDVVTITISYSKSDYRDSYDGNTYTYSSVATVNWSGGSASVTNKGGKARINVAKGTKLLAEYSVYCAVAHPSQWIKSHTDIMQDTFTAASNSTWNIR